MKMIKRILKSVIPAMIIATMSVVLFIGCQSKDTAEQSNKKGNAFNAASMKQRFVDAIKPLVTDKTITQAQSDKIVTALTANTGNFGGQRNGQGTQSGSTKGTNTKPATDGTSGTNTKPATGGTRTNRAASGQSTELAKLVTDKVITQAQADAVTEKLKTLFTRPQGNGNANGNPNTDPNSTDANNQNGQTTNQ